MNPEDDGNISLSKTFGKVLSKNFKKVLSKTFKKRLLNDGYALHTRTLRKPKCRLSIIPGTRPEIIKMSPVIRECERKGLEHFILHTGQHYSYNMDRVFFEQLKLPEARYNLEAGSGAHGEQTGRMMAGIETVIQEDNFI